MAMMALEKASGLMVRIVKDEGKSMSSWERRGVAPRFRFRFRLRRLSVLVPPA